MSHVAVGARATKPAGSWFPDVTREQWMAFIGSYLQDRGLPLATAMAACIAASGLILIVLIWLGPETRGKQFHAIER